MRRLKREKKIKYINNDMTYIPFLYFLGTLYLSHSQFLFQLLDVPVDSDRL